MPSSFTKNYQLSQWERSDKVQMEDFNADNAKIDAALKALDTGKAAQSALDTLSATVSSHTAELAGKGNCQIAVGSYTGKGTYGSAAPRTLTFPFQPQLVVIQNQASAQMDPAKSSDIIHSMLILVRPLQTFYLYTSFAQVCFTWTGNSVRWYSDYTARTQLDESGVQYNYVALG